MNASWDKIDEFVYDGVTVAKFVAPNSEIKYIASGFGEIDRKMYEAYLLKKTANGKQSYLHKLADQKIDEATMPHDENE